jgi:hypothetical protein
MFVTRIHGYEDTVLELDNPGKTLETSTSNCSTISTASEQAATARAQLYRQKASCQPQHVLLNVLRALRDKYESTSPNPFGFDIS